jgi:hypothetical protein
MWTPKPPYFFNIVTCFQLANYDNLRINEVLCFVHGCKLMIYPNYARVDAAGADAREVIATCLPLLYRMVLLLFLLT